MFEEREQEQPFDQIVRARLDGGWIVEASVEELPRDAYSEEPFEVEKEAEEGEEEERPREKIHPVLRSLLDARAADDREQIVITLRDDMTLPRFPEPAMDEPRESETNRRVRQRSEELIREITNGRAENYERVTRELSESYECEVLETFWLVNAMLIKLPPAAVSDLAAREDVLSVEPRYMDVLPAPREDALSVRRSYTELPDESSDAFNSELPRIARDVAGGRYRINSDPISYLDERTSLTIGLIDSGVRLSHVLFNNPRRIALRGDCINGGPDCWTGPNLNFDDQFNHGTQSAGIISANDTLGDYQRGVTRIMVESWKVAVGEMVDVVAVLRAFQKCVAVLDHIIAVPLGWPGADDLSAFSQAADNAFDAGRATIASNGNDGPGSGTVNAPANARKAIGVGCFDVVDLTLTDKQSRGPTLDKRVKPDIQAPTNTLTASNFNDRALRHYGLTSGAAPYAAGAAALVHLFLKHLIHPSTFVIDPGQLYAYLILSGSFPNRTIDNTVGAGRLQLFTDGYIWFGKVSITHHATIDIPLDINTGWYHLDGALWWPEQPGVHNDIDLYLVDGSGQVQAQSRAIHGVFERARFGFGVVMREDWKLRIHGYNVPGGSQWVYWAAHISV